MSIAFPEAFLHYIWKLKLFNFSNLTTTEQESIEILKVGTHNHHAGPDFSNARIRIGNTLWAGSVEIHKKSSDWTKHQHQQDAAYQNTILHVVYEYDAPAYRPTGNSPIPTLVLKNRIPQQYLQRYWQLLNNNSWVACAAQFPKLPAINSLWLDRMAAERLEYKYKAIKLELEQTQYNWETVFYRFLARSFGLQQNAAPFEALAKSLPLLILAKHKQQLHQLEALLFGQAGFLTAESKDNYTKALQKEYRFLQKKYQLTGLLASSWKFGRMRPANFPTIRLAQFAALIHQSKHLFSKILETEQVQALRAMFSIQLEGYWNTHYQLGESSIFRRKQLGRRSVDLILINTIAPFLFSYGRYKGDERYQDRALQLLESLQPEQNALVNTWKSLGLVAKNAQDSQALIQLKKTYCDAKRCLDCAIGHQILKHP